MVSKTDMHLVLYTLNALGEPMTAGELSNFIANEANISHRQAKDVVKQSLDYGLEAMIVEKRNRRFTVNPELLEAANSVENSEHRLPAVRQSEPREQTRKRKRTRSGARSQSRSQSRSESRSQSRSRSRGRGAPLKRSR